jgi:metal transporter CNNM
MESFWTWIAIVVCISQSATFSGLNIALFSLSRLRLEVAVDSGDKFASAILELRRDSNFTLATILWGNVSMNVLLTLLADSIMFGLASFLFSTVIITFIGEIFPQSYFTKNAFKVGYVLAPLLKVYKMIFWPVAKPVGILLDKLVGPEAIPWITENEMINLLKYQAKTAQTELGKMEAIGAVNFLKLDDMPIKKVGAQIVPISMIELSFDGRKPAFPLMKKSSKDPFLQELAKSGKKWVVVLDSLTKFPRLVIDAPDFISGRLFLEENFDPLKFCHQPLVVTDPSYPLGKVLEKWKVKPETPGDDIIDEDLVLLWTEDLKKIISGSDILGRLLREIAVETP